MPKEKKSPKPIVLADTNIFSYLIDKGKVFETLSIIGELENEYEVSFSDVTRYELICTGIAKMRVVVAFLTGRFRLFNIDKDILTFAAFYSCLGIKKVPDSIIAATSFLNDGLILTADNDFCEPYFSEIRHWVVKNVNDKKRMSATIIHLLKVNQNETVTEIQKIKYLHVDEEQKGEK